MSLFRNKYRIESARLKNWDYRNAAAYFITICTKNRECYFWEILSSVWTHCLVETPRMASSLPGNASIQLSPIGKIVESEWLKSPELRPDMNLSLGEFVVMPNHFHGILIIGENQYNIDPVVETHCNASLQQQTQNQFGPQRKNVSSIIRGFKSAVTIQAREIFSDFTWQPRFHDHIIRDYQEYVRIENYIINNPQNWKNDTFNSDAT